MIRAIVLIRICFVLDRSPSILRTTKPWKNFPGVRDHNISKTKKYRRRGPCLFEGFVVRSTHAPNSGAFSLSATASGADAKKVSVSVIRVDKNTSYFHGILRSLRIDQFLCRRLVGAPISAVTRIGPLRSRVP
jgi:hypothetical protein